MKKTKQNKTKHWVIKGLKVWLPFCKISKWAKSKPGD